MVNGEPQKKFHEILPEIVIAKELSDLRNGRENATAGFANLLKVRCVRGVYPEHLVDCWQLYQDHYGTDNDDPEEFGFDQLFIVLEQEYAGVDLEAFQFHNAVQAYSALHQVRAAFYVFLPMFGDVFHCFIFFKHVFAVFVFSYGLACDDG